jgi:Protein O-mannosyl-transferase TMEM260-like
MNYKLLNRIIAVIVLIISAVVLFSTVQPSVSFWDCGEFTAAAYYLQVPHPPGTPFFIIIGRLFSMIPFVANIALRVNTISVLTSASSVFFLYLIIVKVIENYKGRTPKNLSDALGTYIAAAIGALAFSFSDTFWFNGVEAEVYATSTFLFAAVTWMMMEWNERADAKDSEKYLLMIAYLIGIATGVHLMSVLAIVPVVMVIVFRKYLRDEKACKQTGYILLANVALILIIAFAMWGSQTGKNPPTQAEYQAYDTKFKLIVFGISAVIMGAFWKKVFTRNSIYTPLIIGGIALFLVYPGIVKYLPAVMAALGENNVLISVIILLLIFALLGYGVYYTVKEKKATFNLIFLSLIFVLLGFTTFAMVIIRANQHPPMNENEPDQFTELVTYLNREQYGDFPIFKRRFATEPHQMVTYNSYSSDLDFFYSYQMNHMMTRYWLWNYAGRQGWVQDDEANIEPFNKIGNVFGKIISVKFDGDMKDSLFGIPFLLGLIGIYFHFRKDWKMAAVFMVMFILMGYLTAFYQNQQQPQPRERDYFYVGAFFVFAIWIAIAVRSFVDIIIAKYESRSLKNIFVYGILVLGIILVPANMLRANYFTHDRSKNWIPWDYSYNLLQSCATNAVLFTNGDNDTFPLWYMQDVEGVRRDVKVVNLSLLNTDWYIKQLKNDDPYHVGTVNLNLNDAQIGQLHPIQWEPRDIEIPINPAENKGSLTDFYQAYNLTDSSIVKQGYLKFRMKNTLTVGRIKAIRVQDIMVKEIIEANHWQRPIYFAVTCATDSKIGLDDYLRMEGMALRLVPEKRKPNEEFVNEKVLKQEIIENPGYSKTYKPGFKFRGLNSHDIFFDDNHQRMVQNYRSAFMRLAIYYVNNGKNKLAVNALDLMDEKLPRDIIKMDLALEYEIANVYYVAKAMKQYKNYASEIEEKALVQLDNNSNDVQSYYNPYRILIDTYQNLKDYPKLLDIWQRIQSMYPNDPNVKANVERYKRMVIAKKDSLSNNN